MFQVGMMYKGSVNSEDIDKYRSDIALVMRHKVNKQIEFSCEELMFRSLFYLCNNL